MIDSKGRHIRFFGYEKRAEKWLATTIKKGETGKGPSGSAQGVYVFLLKLFVLFVSV